ncbi:MULTISPECIES: hypothetical protein [Planococcus]|uniref:DUF2187 domain-containing protein n=2 Tax=Planococcus TaxID=1372 RepID=A0ABM5X033_9BACL|nr:MULTISPECIES: hypothetical protein [Planococcus]ALS79983.1 hypothetical protein AUO94_15750 [Planococcus kocurii]AQU78034.1 hypothetical protein AJGP001_01355 [Planococcus faecalis]KAA0957405.1 hypothetical protein FQ085_09870 [Planococcus sp. ANT_H30]MDJ0331345.1 hypothetical protein [Planococcus sp. S3-L1]OHX52476.1 hypothetical protein BB777_11775 [Planococcus faecalis]
MKQKFYVYNILLTNGEYLENIRVEGPLEDHFPGVSVSLFSVENIEGKTIVLSVFHIVKADLISIEES